MVETWKPVKGYDDLYAVSNIGRVMRTTTGRILTQKINESGYAHVLLFKNGKGKPFLIHRLVAIAFIPTQDESLTINHIDEDKLNNSVENLEWCTLRENIRKYTERHELQWRCNSSKRGRPRIPHRVRQLNADGSLVKEWDSVSDIHKTMNYNNWSISQCCNGRRRTAYGFKWQYAN